MESRKPTLAPLTDPSRGGFFFDKLPGDFRIIVRKIFSTPTQGLFHYGRVSSRGDYYGSFAPGPR